MPEKLRVKEEKRFYYPADHKLVCKIDARKDRSEGGLVIPDKAQDKQTMVTVLAVAENLKDKFAPGDRICYGGLYQMEMIDQGLIILRYPEEVMYKFEDKQIEREETDAEFADRLAAENRKEELNKGGKLILVS